MTALEVNEEEKKVEGRVEEGMEEGEVEKEVVIEDRLVVAPAEVSEASPTLQGEHMETTNPPDHKLEQSLARQQTPTSQDGKQQIRPPNQHLHLTLMVPPIQQLKNHGRAHLSRR